MCLVLVWCDCESTKYTEQPSLLSVSYASHRFFSMDIGRNVYLLKARNSWACFPIKHDHVVLGFILGTRNNQT